MSRVIKFRAWDKSDGVMYETISFEDMMKMEIMQFTGLLDKNGKEIYEGDILLEGNFKFMITWDCTWAKFKIQSIHHYQYPEFNRGIRMQIIGNIHQNPELL